jgi:hypothetical protein
MRRILLPVQRAGEIAPEIPFLSEFSDHCADFVSEYDKQACSYLTLSVFAPVLPAYGRLKLRPFSILREIG